MAGGKDYGHDYLGNYMWGKFILNMIILGKCMIGKTTMDNWTGLFWEIVSSNSWKDFCDGCSMLAMAKTCGYYLAMERL